MNQRELMLFADSQMRAMSSNLHTVSAPYNQLPLVLQSFVVSWLVPQDQRNTDASMEVEGVLITIFKNVDPTVIISMDSAKGYSFVIHVQDLEKMRAALMIRMQTLFP